MERRNEERPYNYLDKYRVDEFADKRGLDPIIFDWSNVSEVEIIDEVKGWDQSKIDKYAGRPGHTQFHKYLVKCPKHNEFFQLIEDEPRPWSYHCYHCISDEKNRVGKERFLRDREYYAEGQRRPNSR